MGGGGDACQSVKWQESALLSKRKKPWDNGEKRVRGGFGGGGEREREKQVRLGGGGGRERSKCISQRPPPELSNPT